MAKLLVSHKDTKIQSEAVFGQFGEKIWIPYAKENAKLPHFNSEKLKGCGVGKFLVSCAMGASLEENVDIIKKYRDKIDVLTCDKGFGPLLDHGIKADYVVICDCNVLYKHLEPYVNETKGVKLLCTPYANIEWTSAWQGERYLFINRDAIKTERVFMDIVGKDIRQIPAGSNVSNAMCIFFMGVDEKSNINWSGYEKIFLVGYDYSWRPFGNYYAWANPTPKRFYMNHRTLLDMANEWVFTSENLMFSAKWMYSYNQAYDMPLVNCSQRGLLPIKRQGKLDEELKKINGEKSSVDLVRRSLDMVLSLKKSYEEAIGNFNKAREGLLQWQ